MIRDGPPLEFPYLSNKYQVIAASVVDAEDAVMRDLEERLNEGDVTAMSEYKALQAKRQSDGVDRRPLCEMMAAAHPAFDGCASRVLAARRKDDTSAPAYYLYRNREALIEAMLTKLVWDDASAFNVPYSRECIYPMTEEDWPVEFHVDFEETLKVPLASRDDLDRAEREFYRRCVWFVRLANAGLSSVYLLNGGRVRMRWYSACTLKKLSFHLHLESWQWRNSSALRAFITLLRTSLERCAHDHPMREALHITPNGIIKKPKTAGDKPNEWIVDWRIYNDHRQFRGPYQRKAPSTDNALVPFDSWNLVRVPLDRNDEDALREWLVPGLGVACAQGVHTHGTVPLLPAPDDMTAQLFQLLEAERERRSSGPMHALLGVALRIAYLAYLDDEKRRGLDTARSRMEAIWNALEKKAASYIDSSLDMSLASVACMVMIREALYEALRPPKEQVSVAPVIFSRVVALSKSIGAPSQPPLAGFGPAARFSVWIARTLYQQARLNPELLGDTADDVCTYEEGRRHHSDDDEFSGSGEISSGGEEDEDSVNMAGSNSSSSLGAKDAHAAECRAVLEWTHSTYPRDNGVALAMAAAAKQQPSSARGIKRSAGSDLSHPIPILETEQMQPCSRSPPRRPIKERREKREEAIPIRAMQQPKGGAFGCWAPIEAHHHLGGAHASALVIYPGGPRVVPT